MSLSTATLTIINLNSDVCRNALSSREDVLFLVHLSLSDLHMVPPFLPAITMTVRKETLGMLRRSLQEVNDVYRNCLEYEIAVKKGGKPQEGMSYERGVGDQKSGKERITELIAEIGIHIYNMGVQPKSFGAMINYLTSLHDRMADEQIDNLIIYTNDVSIPWPWTFNMVTGALLCDEYALGTIFSANPLEIGEIVRTHDDSQATHSPVQAGTPLSLIVGGNLDLCNDPGDLKAEDNVDIADHIREIRRLLVDPDGVSGDLTFDADYFLESDVKVLSKHFDDASARTDVLEEFCHFMYNPRNSNSLKLLHYVGHFNDEKLILDQGKEIDRDDLKNISFASQPLVFLNCCRCSAMPDIESLQSIDASGGDWSPGSNFSTFLLNKRACGVIVTLLPIHSYNHSFAVNFYQGVLQGHLSVGSALRAARNGALQDDPERWFFQLYGDPRMCLF